MPLAEKINTPEMNPKLINPKGFFPPRNRRKNNVIAFFQINKMSTIEWKA